MYEIPCFRYLDSFRSSDASALRTTTFLPLPVTAQVDAKINKRIRASDLLKKCCRVGEEKYDFSKIVDLKGGSGRDATKKGRPPGITSCMPSKTAVKPVALTLPDAVPCETETVVEDSTTERLLTSEEVYCNLLKESDGLFMIDKTYQKFMLQDFDKDRMAHKRGKFLFTTRRGMAFNEDMHWIYKCTCDVTRSELIECCGDRMHVPYSGKKKDFSANLNQIIHVKDAYSSSDIVARK